jgi:Tfp pilus assembly protein PilF
MDKSLQRALVLFEQNRYDLAEQELRQALAADPNVALAHAYLALCLSERKQFTEATEAARTAIHLEPDAPFAHYVLSRVLLDRDRPDEAEVAIDEAIRLDPGDANYHAMRSQARLAQKEWTGALEAAEEGLECDPEHVTCANAKAMALTQLGRTEEAQAALAATLAKEPENAFSHANQGWSYLHQHDTNQALEHFREALRLDPELDFARQGMVEALKARNPIYGLMLRYFLWMGRLGGTAQWAIILGLYFGNRFLSGLARENPALRPWIRPLLIAYIVFAIMTWIASPLFNLLLFLNRYGRYALSRDQRWGAVTVGLLSVPALASLATGLATNHDVAWLGAIYFGLLLLPVSAIYNCAAGWPRRWMVAYTVALAASLPASLVVAPFNRDLSSLLYLGFFGGSFLSGFVANGLLMARVRH